jgi:hypothetical protein
MRRFQERSRLTPQIVLSAPSMLLIPSTVVRNRIAAPRVPSPAKSSLSTIVRIRSPASGLPAARLSTRIWARFSRTPSAPTSESAIASSGISESME